MCNTPRVGVADQLLPGTVSFSTAAPLPGRAAPAASSSSVQSAASQLRHDVRSNLSTRSSAHSAQATQAIEEARRARELARETREQHALAGLDQGGLTNTSLNGSAYPYAARGAQLASLARQGQRPRRAQASQISLGRADAEAKGESDLDESIATALSGLRQAHERETAAQAFRRTQAQVRLHRDTLGEDEQDDPSIPEMDSPSGAWENTEASPRDVFAHASATICTHPCR